MFGYTAGWLNEVHLLTSTPPSTELAKRIHPAARISILGEGLSGLKFKQAARIAADKIIREANSRKEAVVLHDLAIARLISSRSSKNDLVRGVVSIYSPTCNALRTRAWRTKPDSPLQWQQELRHIWSTVSRIPLEWHVCRYADAVVGNSEEIVSDVIRFYGKKPENVFLLPTEIDLSYFSSRERSETNPPTVLFLGRLYVRKGVFDLLDTARQLKDEGLSFNVVMAGDGGAEQGKLERAVISLGLDGLVSILPRQPREKVLELLLSAAVFVLPSYFEGSPRVVKEAMAAGCPVVTYDLPGTRGLDPNGTAIRFVPKGNVSGLVTEVRRLLLDRDMRQLQGTIGKKVVQRYDVPNVARQMVELYQSLFT